MSFADCRRVREIAVAGGALDVPEIAAHAEGCPACRTLLADGEGLARTLGAEAPPDAAAELALSELRGGARLGDLPTPARWGIVLAVAAAVAGAVAVATPRPDLAAVRVADMAWAIATLLVAVGLALSAALWPLWRPLAAPRAFWTLAVAMALPIGLCTIPVHVDHPASLGGTGSELVPRALACFAFGSVCALAGLVAGLLVRRPGLRVAAVGLALAAAGLGAIALQLHCPLSAVEHRLAGHGSVVLAFLGGALAVAYGRRR